MYDAIIEANANTYGIVSVWVHAIIQIESNWNPLAIRYEPNYNYILTPDKFVTYQNTLATEINTQKISWGLGQIMGGLARQQGHNGLMTELLNPTLNIEMICKYLKTLTHYSTVETDIIAAYNAGPGVLKKKHTDGTYPNQVYVDRVMTVLKNLH